MNDWLYQVKVGSVLKWPSGMLRPIRVMHDRRPDLRKTWCYFVIKRCSWTHRCYTLYNLGELRGMGVTYAGVNVRFKDALSEKIVSEMEDWTEFRLTCCAVKGLP